MKYYSIMRFLILATDYPNTHGGMGLAYIRTRNVYYQTHGVDVDVLNFSSKEDYEIDGIKVYSLHGYKKYLAKTNFDLLISHASNLRNHYLFLMKYAERFPKIVFFYHGHEVLNINRVYSKPYPFVKRNLIKEKCQDLYDSLKFFVWRNYINRHYKKLYHVFVSHWMKDEFMHWVHPNLSSLEDRSFITYNSVGEVFEKEMYTKDLEKAYDFVTIRGMLDKSKYAVDIVNELAKRNSSRKFLLIGKGSFFKHNLKADNLTWIDGLLSHEEMLAVLNSAKCALMPTRTDAQGVMMCEMATFGLPLITSDIPVCHEVFADFEGVGFIDNENYNNCDLSVIYDNLKDKSAKNSKYFYSTIMSKELKDLIHIVRM